MTNIDRRSFISAGSLMLAATMVEFPHKILAADASLNFGYAAITWGDDVKLFCDQISILGFKSIQLRKNCLKAFDNDKFKLKEYVQSKGLITTVLSSGEVNFDNPNPALEMDSHLKNAELLKYLGGKYLQVIGPKRTKGKNPTKDQLVQFADALNSLGSRVKDFGVELLLHNHMDFYSESPSETDIILDNTDPAKVNFLLDIAHYKQGGGDPISVINKRFDRIKVVHLKDVVYDMDGQNGKDYKFTTLGSGSVKVKEVLQLLSAKSFKGCAIIELDAVPEKGQTALQCATINKEYLVKSGYSL